MAKEEKPAKAEKAEKPAKAEKSAKAAAEKPVEKPVGPREKAPPARLRKHYEDVVRPSLVQKFGYKNPMAVPKITKIVVNMGVGEASQDKKKIEGAVDNLAAITGQKPLITKSRKAIANFKLRENQMVGA